MSPNDTHAARLRTKAQRILEDEHMHVVSVETSYEATETTCTIILKDAADSEQRAD